MEGVDKKCGICEEWNLETQPPIPYGITYRKCKIQKLFFMLFIIVLFILMDIFC